MQERSGRRGPTPRPKRSTSPQRPSNDGSPSPKRSFSAKPTRKSGAPDKKFGSPDKKFGSPDKKFGSSDKKFGSSERNFSKPGTKFNSSGSGFSSSDSGDSKPDSKFTKRPGKFNKPRPGGSGGFERPGGASAKPGSGFRKSDAFEKRGSFDKRGSSFRKEEPKPETDEARFSKPEAAADRPGRKFVKTDKYGKPVSYKKAAGARPKRPKAGSSAEKGVRLNKFLANAGVCSRREADELIATGVVKVNGEIVTQMGLRVQAGDIVHFGDRKISGEPTVYILLNKPKDYLTTTKDPRNRKTVMELIKSTTTCRVFPVGRLDRMTTGVLLFTNDGDLADSLMHPSSQVEKIYHVELDQKFASIDMDTIRRGLNLEDGPITPDEVEWVTGMDKKHVGIKLHSGRNRIVRRMFEQLGYKVMRLDRVLFAGLTKKGLTRGASRQLTDMEVRELKKLG